jgi:hypothetical protein
VFAHFCGTLVTAPFDAFPSLTVAFQNLAAGAVKFRAMFLQTSKKSAIARPRRNGMTEPSHIRTARGLFLGRTAGLGHCGRSHNGQNGHHHKFTDHFSFSLLLWPHASGAAGVPLTQLGIGSLVAVDSFAFIVA